MDIQQYLDNIGIDGQNIIMKDEVEEEVIKIQPIYEAIKEHPEADKEEIYKMLK